MGWQQYIPASYSYSNPVKETWSTWGAQPKKPVPKPTPKKQPQQQYIPASYSYSNPVKETWSTWGAQPKKPVPAATGETGGITQEAAATSSYTTGGSPYKAWQTWGMEPQSAEAPPDWWRIFNDLVK